ncbi:MAG: hypothetical protein HY721_06175 [Planctomycetes bacterium]|nr:hypothetical protein [Planctomycetota bacterium]
MRKRRGEGRDGPGLTPAEGGFDPEAEIDDLVASYVDRLVGGERVSPERVLEEHPDVGREVLSRLRVFLEAGGAEAASDDGAGPALGTIGDYTLRRRIGRGGMGVVYEAW